VKRMLPAGGAILLELQPVRIVAAILLGGVVAALTIAALQRDHRANILLL